MALRRRLAGMLGWCWSLLRFHGSRAWIWIIWMFDDVWKDWARSRSRSRSSLSLSIDCTGMIYHDISWYTIAIHSHVGIWGAQLIGTPALAPAAALRGHDEQYTREILTPAACLQWAWPDITWVILSTCLAFFGLISCNRERERKRQGVVKNLSRCHMYWYAHTHGKKSNWWITVYQ